ncbi:AAA family ATPase [Chloroflexota bacterium]
MRIDRLDLLRYGHFTNTSVPFPMNNPDIHILFGPNEAGKSTALSALEDFLFGIPHNSTLDFIHDYSSMLIGAIVQENDANLECRRRKGKKDTLLTVDGLPLPDGDGAMAKFLPGIDRSFFERMFSLDHHRLRQGGKEILESRDEVGQMLFSASTGITGLRDRLNTLNAEADILWAPRKAAHRKYYQGDEQLKIAEKELQGHTVTSANWEKYRRAYNEALEAYQALEKELQKKTVELRRLSRIRRVYRDVQKKSRLDSEIAELGDVLILPEDAKITLDEAERKDDTIFAQIKTLTDRLNEEREECKALIYDEGLLIREKDVKVLRDRRIQIRVERVDLPKRQAELASAEAELKRLAAEIEWNDDDIERLISGLPPRLKVNTIRSLIAKRVKILSIIQGAQETLEETERRIKEIQEQLDDLGEGVDVSKLAAVVKAIRQRGDTAALIRGAEDRIREAQVAVEHRLNLLKPSVIDVESLISMDVPNRATVESQRDNCRDLEKRQQNCRDQINSNKEALERLRKSQERMVLEGDIVSPEELHHIREYRDSGWSLIRRRYIEGYQVSDDEVSAFINAGGDISAVYEKAIQDADHTADKRFDHAEMAATLAELYRQAADLEDVLNDLQNRADSIDRESENLEAIWKEMWPETISPLTVDDMLDWLDIRKQILELIEGREAASREVIDLQREEAESKDRLLQETETFSVNTTSLKDQSLSVTLESVTEILHQYEQENRTQQELKKNLRKESTDKERKQKLVEDANSQLSEWEDDWANALSGLGLEIKTSPEIIQDQINAIDAMRETVVLINELRHKRIDMMKCDISAFEKEVSEVVNAVAPEIAEMGADDAVISLESRLDNAIQIKKQQDIKNKNIEDLKAKIDEFENRRKEALQTIDHLQQSASAGNIDELKNAITKSDQFREMQTELSELTGTLIREGDGLTLDELKLECDSVELDQIAAQEEIVGVELEDIRKRLMEELERCNEARRLFESIGGGDHAAIAAANRQAALADMTGAAEQYVRLRSAALLLEWAIERFRRQKQAPLLKRAGQLFATLTNESFAELGVVFDDHDNPHLAGIRPNDMIVNVGGLSTGSADQLYLALRLASVEDYLTHANPLPFIADDLLINFDDNRAAAGLKVLGELAQKTQVIFFTHHQHLVDIACQTLGPSISVVSLS